VILSRLIDFLEKRSSLKKAIVLVMLIIPFNALFFPLVGDYLENLSGHRLFDSLFFYNPELIATYLQAYGPVGRKLYLFADCTLDLVYPVIYTLLFSMLLTLILQRGFSPDSPLRRMQLLPFGMMAFDYLENISVCALLLLFPTQPTWLAWAAATFTTLKWCFAAMSGLALLIGLVGVLISQLRQKE
jgi:hypothetical protein